MLGRDHGKLERSILLLEQNAAPLRSKKGIYRVNGRNTGRNHALRQKVHQVGSFYCCYLTTTDALLVANVTMTTTQRSSGLFSSDKEGAGVGIGRKKGPHMTPPKSEGAPTQFITMMLKKRE